jgi:aminoglycoside 6-adenylyltransferase
MRSDRQMLDLILETARQDERIRAVIMNGSRVNPRVPPDCFQDFDIIYLVTDVASFKADPDWHKRFGEIMILQLPEDMQDPPAEDTGEWVYLMQFMDGNRIDLCLHPVARARDVLGDSLSLVLLDKDGILPPLPAPNESSYLPEPPTAKQFADCCNEFWWCSPYVAKGLWRGQVTYAKAILDEFVRAQLMKMLAWYVGVRTGFSQGPGYLGKHLQQQLEPHLWDMLMATYSGASCDATWNALLAIGSLFRLLASSVAEHFDFAYPYADDERVSAHLSHVRQLPGDATEIY